MNYENQNNCLFRIVLFHPIKLSPRRCRFDLVEVKEWFKNQYGQQRRK